MTTELLSTLFRVLIFVMVSVVIGLFSRYLTGRARSGAIAVFVAWLLYAGVMGYVGIIALKRPPGPAFLLVPILLFLVALRVSDSPSG